MRLKARGEAAHSTEVCSGGLLSIMVCISGYWIEQFAYAIPSGENLYLSSKCRQLRLGDLVSTLKLGIWKKSRKNSCDHS